MAADLKAISQNALASCFANEVAREFDVLVDAFALANTPDEKAAALKRMETGLASLKEAYGKASDLVERAV